MGIKERRQKEKHRRIKEIQDAAKLVFFKRGYFNSTVEEIAELAEISKGTIYLYFKNKDELYVSLMIPLIEEYGRLLEEFENSFSNRTSNNSADIIAGFFELLIKLQKFDPEGLKVFQIFHLMNLFSELSKEVRERLRTLGKNNVTITRRIISKSIELGWLPEVDPFQLNDFLLALFIGIVQIEEHKLKFSKKDHLYDMMMFASSLVSRCLTYTKK